MTVPINMLGSDDALADHNGLAWGCLYNNCSSRQASNLSQSAESLLTAGHSGIAFDISLMTKGYAQDTNIRRDGSDFELTASKIVLVVTMSIVNLLMLMGNSLSVVTILYSRALRKRIYYWLVLNLAVLDLINSLTVVPVNAMWEYFGVWPHNQASCNVVLFADLSFSGIASYSTVLMSIDKYLYITKPFAYHSIMAPGLAIGAIVSVWVAWFTYSAVSVFGGVARNSDPNTTLTLDRCNFVMTDTYAVVSAIITFFLPLVILLFTSFKILSVARQHIRKITASHRPSFTETRSLSATNVNSPPNDQRGSLQSETVNLQKTRPSLQSITSGIRTRSLREFFSSHTGLFGSSRSSNGTIPIKNHASLGKAIGTVMIVIIFYIIMFAPYWFAAVIQVSCNCIQPWVFEDYLTNLYYMHSLVNPYIYMATDRRYKHAIKRLYRKVCQRTRGNCPQIHNISSGVP